MKANKELIKIQEELNKLDKDYFHTHISYDKNGNFSWLVYYENMNSKDYLSMKNQAILNSKYNDINDIKKLNTEFEKIRDIANNNISLDKSYLSMDVFNVYFSITKKLGKIFELIGFSLMLIMTIIFLLKIDIKIFITIGITLVISYAVLLFTQLYTQKIIKDETKRFTSKEKKRLLKIYLKDNEMRGLRYEFTKKNRKKFIEENKEYRQKKERV